MAPPEEEPQDEEESGAELYKNYAHDHTQAAAAESDGLSDEEEKEEHAKEEAPAAAADPVDDSAEIEANKAQVRQHTTQSKVGKWLKKGEARAGAAASEAAAAGEDPVEQAPTEEEAPPAKPEEAAESSEEDAQPSGTQTPALAEEDPAAAAVQASPAASSTPSSSPAKGKTHIEHRRGRTVTTSSRIASWGLMDKASIRRLGGADQTKWLPPKDVEVADSTEAVGTPPRARATRKQAKLSTDPPQVEVRPTKWTKVKKEVHRAQLDGTLPAAAVSSRESREILKQRALNPSVWGARMEEAEEVLQMLAVQKDLPLHDLPAMTQEDLASAKAGDFRLFQKLVKLLDNVGPQVMSPRGERARYHHSNTGIGKYEQVEHDIRMKARKEWPHLDTGETTVHVDVLDIAQAQYRTAEARAHGLQSLVGAEEHELKRCKERTDAMKNGKERRVAIEEYLRHEAVVEAKRSLVELATYNMMAAKLRATVAADFVALRKEREEVAQEEEENAADAWAADQLANIEGKLNAIRGMSPKDRIKAIKKLSPKARAALLAAMTPEERELDLASMSAHDRVITVQAMGVTERIQALKKMSVEEQARIISSMMTPHRKATLEAMDPEHRARVLGHMDMKERLAALTSLSPREKAESLAAMSMELRLKALATMTPMDRALALQHMTTKMRAETLAAMSREDRLATLEAEFLNKKMAKLTPDDQAKAIKSMSSKEKRAAMHSFGPRERAKVMKTMPAEELKESLLAMSPEDLAEAFAAMSPEQRHAVLALMNDQQVFSLMRLLSAEDRVLALKSMTAQERIEYFKSLSAEERAEIEAEEKKAKRFHKLNHEQQAAAFASMSDAEKAIMLHALSPHERAVLLAGLSPEERAAALACMSEADREATLHAEEEEEAFRHMTHAEQLELLKDMTEAEKLAFFDVLSTEEKAALLAAMSPEERAACLSHLSPAEREALLQVCTPEERAAILAVSSDEERAAAFHHMSAEERAAALEKMSPEEREAALALMSDEERATTLEAEARLEAFHHMSHEDQMAFLEGRSPEEKSAYLSALSHHERAILLHAMSPEDRAAYLASLSPEKRAELLDGCPPELKASLLAEMSPADRAAALAHMSPEERAAALARMSPAEREEALAHMSQEDRDATMAAEAKMDAFSHLSTEAQLAALDHMSEAQKAAYLSSMSNEAKAQLLLAMSPEERDAYLASLSEEERLELLNGCPPELKASILSQMSDEHRKATLAALSPEEREMALAAMSPEARQAAKASLSWSAIRMDVKPPKGMVSLKDRQDARKLWGQTKENLTELRERVTKKKEIAKLNALDPADLAAALEAMSSAERQEALLLMTDQERADALSTLSPEDRASLLASMSPSMRKNALDRMSIADRALALANLSEEDREAYLAGLSDEERRLVLGELKRAQGKRMWKKVKRTMIRRTVDIAEAAHQSADARARTAKLHAQRLKEVILEREVAVMQMPPSEEKDAMMGDLYRGKATVTAKTRWANAQIYMAEVAAENASATRQEMELQSGLQKSKAGIEAKTNELESLTPEDRAEALGQMAIKQRVAALKWWSPEYRQACLEALADHKAVSNEALEETHEKLGEPDEAEKMLASAKLRKAVAELSLGKATVAMANATHDVETAVLEQRKAEQAANEQKSHDIKQKKKGFWKKDMVSKLLDASKNATEEQKGTVDRMKRWQNAKKALLDAAHAKVEAAEHGVAIASMEEGESKSDALAEKELSTAEAEAAEATAEAEAVSVEVESADWDVTSEQNKPAPSEKQDEHEVQAQEGNLAAKEQVLNSKQRLKEVLLARAQLAQEKAQIVATSVNARRQAIEKQKARDVEIEQKKQGLDDFEAVQRETQAILEMPPKKQAQAISALEPRQRVKILAAMDNGTMEEAFGAMEQSDRVATIIAMPYKQRVDTLYNMTQEGKTKLLCAMFPKGRKATLEMQTHERRIQNVLSLPRDLQVEALHWMKVSEMNDVLSSLKEEEMQVLFALLEPMDRAMGCSEMDPLLREDALMALSTEESVSTEICIEMYEDMMTMSLEDRLFALAAMENAERRQVLHALEPKDRRRCVSRMTREHRGECLNAMSRPDRVECLMLMPVKDRGEAFMLMDKKEANHTMFDLTPEYRAEALLEFSETEREKMIMQLKPEERDCTREAVEIAKVFVGLSVQEKARKQSETLEEKLERMDQEAEEERLADEKVQAEIKQQLDDVNRHLVGIEESHANALVASVHNEVVLMDRDGAISAISSLDEIIPATESKEEAIKQEMQSRKPAAAGGEVQENSKPTEKEDIESKILGADDVEEATQRAMEAQAFAAERAADEMSNEIQEEHFAEIKAMNESDKAKALAALDPEIREEICSDMTPEELKVIHHATHFVKQMETRKAAREKANAVVVMPPDLRGVTLAKMNVQEKALVLRAVPDEERGALEKTLTEEELEEVGEAEENLQEQETKEQKHRQEEVKKWQKAFKSMEPLEKAKALHSLTTEEQQERLEKELTEEEQEVVEEYNQSKQEEAEVRDRRKQVLAAKMKWAKAKAASVEKAASTAAAARNYASVAMDLGGLGADNDQAKAESKLDQDTAVMQLREAETVMSEAELDAEHAQLAQHEADVGAAEGKLEEAQRRLEEETAQAEANAKPVQDDEGEPTGEKTISAKTRAALKKLKATVTELERSKDHAVKGLESQKDTVETAKSIAAAKKALLDAAVTKMEVAQEEVKMSSMPDGHEKNAAKAKINKNLAKAEAEQASVEAEAAEVDLLKSESEIAAVETELAEQEKAITAATIKATLEGEDEDAAEHKAQMTNRVENLVALADAKKQWLKSKANLAAVLKERAELRAANAAELADLAQESSGGEEAEEEAEAEPEDVKSETPREEEEAVPEPEALPEVPDEPREETLRRLGVEAYLSTVEQAAPLREETMQTLSVLGAQVYTSLFTPPSPSKEAASQEEDKAAPEVPVHPKLKTTPGGWKRLRKKKDLAEQMKRVSLQRRMDEAEARYAAVVFQLSLKEQEMHKLEAHTKAEGDKPRGGWHKVKSLITTGNVLIAEALLKSSEAMAQLLETSLKLRLDRGHVMEATLGVLLDEKKRFDMEQCIELSKHSVAALTELKEAQGHMTELSVKHEYHMRKHTAMADSMNAKMKAQSIRDGLVARQHAKVEEGVVAEAQLAVARAELEEEKNRVRMAVEGHTALFGIQAWRYKGYSVEGIEKWIEATEHFVVARKTCAKATAMRLKVAKDLVSCANMEDGERKTKRQTHFQIKAAEERAAEAEAETSAYIMDRKRSEADLAVTESQTLFEKERLDKLPRLEEQAAYTLDLAQERSLQRKSLESYESLRDAKQRLVSAKALLAEGLQRRAEVAKDMLTALEESMALGSSMARREEVVLAIEAKMSSVCREVGMMISSVDSAEVEVAVTTEQTRGEMEKPEEIMMRNLSGIGALVYRSLQEPMLRYGNLSAMGQNVLDNLKNTARRKARSAAKEVNLAQQRHKAMLEAEFQLMLDGGEPRDRISRTIKNGVFEVKTVKQIHTDYNFIRENPKGVYKTEAEIKAFYNRLTKAEAARSEKVVENRIASLQEEEKMMNLPAGTAVGKEEAKTKATKLSMETLDRLYSNRSLKETAKEDPEKESSPGGDRVVIGDETLSHPMVEAHIERQQRGRHLAKEKQEKESLFRPKEDNLKDMTKITKTAEKAFFRRQDLAALTKSGRDAENYFEKHKEEENQIHARSLHMRKKRELEEYASHLHASPTSSSDARSNLRADRTQQRLEEPKAPVLHFGTTPELDLSNKPRKVAGELSPPRKRPPPKKLPPSQKAGSPLKDAPPTAGSTVQPPPVPPFELVLDGQATTPLQKAVQKALLAKVAQTAVVMSTSSNNPRIESEKNNRAAYDPATPSRTPDRRTTAARKEQDGEKVPSPKRSQRLAIAKQLHRSGPSSSPGASHKATTSTLKNRVVLMGRKATPK